MVHRRRELGDYDDSRAHAQDGSHRCHLLRRVEWPGKAMSSSGRNWMSRRPVRCYTSGTTGNPKGVLYSHRSTVLHTYATLIPDAMNISSGDVMLPIVPMFHVNAWGNPYACPAASAKMVMPGNKMGDGPTLAALINEEGVTMSAGVPTVWLNLLAHLRESGNALRA